VLVRALGSAGRFDAAADAASQAVKRQPLHVELRLLQAIVLLESGRAVEAAAAARAALYLDAEVAMAHLTLARAEHARGAMAAAIRCYRNALSLLEARPADEAVPFADGESACRLAAMARAGQRVVSQPTTTAQPR
jgi:chemotaxis protein methyltransferase CheR